MRILVNDGMDQSGLNKLIKLGVEVDTNHYVGEDLVREIKNADGIIIRSATKIRKDLIDAAAETGRLKLIIRAGVGVDNIDVEYAEKNGIEVRNTPLASSASVAELAIGHMFSIARFINISNVTMRNGEWNKNQYEGFELQGKTLGLIGFGRIAREVAKRADAIGMKVVYTDIMGKLDGYEKYEYLDKENLLKTCDILSLHVPFIPSIGEVIGKSEIQSMKDGACIIDCARGGVVNEDALLEALENGKLYGAGLDVFTEEPTPNKALINNPKVSVTPHIGAATKEAQERIGQEVIDIVTGFIGGVNNNGNVKAV